MAINYPPLSRLADEQPRVDGSVHDEHFCYLCGASTRDVAMDPVIRANLTTGKAEYWFACHSLTECVQRAQAVTS